MQGAHAGLLLIKPASQVGSAINNEEPPKNSLTDGQNQQLQETPDPYFDLSQAFANVPGYASLPEFKARLGEGSNIQNKNERTFSLLFGSKKPTPLRPHPVTKALPPQVNLEHLLNTFS